jgi:hypothetical protein
MDVSGQNLRGYSFRGQNLKGANFSGADLRGTDFSGADLQGADLRHAKLGMRFPRLRSALICLLLVVASISCVFSWDILLDFNRLNDVNYHHLIDANQSTHNNVLVAINGAAALAACLLSPNLSIWLAPAKPYGMDSEQELPVWAKVIDRRFNLWGLALCILLLMLAAGLLQQVNQIVSIKMTTDPTLKSDFLEGGVMLGGSAALLVMLGVWLSNALLQVCQQSPRVRVKCWIVTGLVAIVALALGQLFPFGLIFLGLASVSNIAVLGLVPMGILSAAVYGGLGLILGRLRWSLPVIVGIICLLLSPAWQNPIYYLNVILVLGVCWIPCGIFVRANQRTRFNQANLNGVIRNS